MRSRRSADEAAEVARRRLALLSAELAEIRSGGPTAPVPGGTGNGPQGSGSGELPTVPPATTRAAPAPAPGRHARRPLPAPSPFAGWLHDRLPATLQGRVRLSGPHVTVLALVVAAAVALAAWQVARAGGSDVVAVTRVSSGVTTTPDGSPSSAGPAAVGLPPGPPAGPSPSASPSGTVVVDVTGKVRRPGIATLPEGSRVVDALRAAGGARRGASLAGLNLARVLSDGEQVVVGVAPASGTAASLAAAPTASTPGALVNINTAAQPELESLPGVGPVTAQKILAYRQDNGAFSSVDQLLDVSGIGEATLAEMAPFCTI
jgi:competence protein ComEA